MAPNWLSLHRRQTGNPGGGRSFLLAGGPSSFGCRNQSDQLEPYCSNASMLGIDRRVFWHSRTLEGYHMLSRMNSMKLRGSPSIPRRPQPTTTVKLAEGAIHFIAGWLPTCLAAVSMRSLPSWTVTTYICLWTCCRVESGLAWTVQESGGRRQSLN